MITTSQQKVESLITPKQKDESDYIQFCITAFKLLQERDYKNAGIQYKESLTLARKLEDDYKYSDSLTNYGITQFYCGKITESIQNLESALRMIQKLLNTNEKKNLSLYIKILANLFLANISLGKVSEANSHITTLLSFIKSLENLFDQQRYLKQVIYIFFRVESLINFIDKYFKYNYDIGEKILITEENKNSEEILERISMKIIYFLHKYLREKDIDSWIKCLNEESENYKFLKDYNGFVFAIYNQYASIYCKDPINNLSKIKISNICKALCEKKNFEEKQILEILNEARDKSNTAIEVYNKFYEMEAELEKKIAQDKLDRINTGKVKFSRGKIVRNDPNVLFKIFLRYALNFFNETEKNEEENNLNKLEYMKEEKYHKQLKNQINLTLQLIEKGQLDMSSINLQNIDPEIYEAFVIVGENLMFIKYKNLIRKFFKRYRKKIKTLRFIEKRKKFNAFMTDKYDLICKGSTLTKLNFSNNGRKEHFYQINGIDGSLRVFKKKGEKGSAHIPLSEIKYFGYGISSENLKAKYLSLQSNKLNYPWLFFSIMTQKRSIDFYMEEKDLNAWFYGIKKFLELNNESKKMVSVSNFVFRKLKMKMIIQLNDELIKQKDNKNLSKFLTKFKILISSAKQVIDVLRIPFCKIFKLYLKVKNPKI